MDSRYESGFINADEVTEERLIINEENACITYDASEPIDCSRAVKKTPSACDVSVTFLAEL